MNTPPPDFDPPIAGASTAMNRLKQDIAQVADSPANVLITGESGTGKEIVALNLHSRSRRKERAFVPVNCAALNPGVLESELFGHSRGSFTGAIRAHAGLFEQANRGTLFLDEIGEIPSFIQAKLLRVVQDRVIRPMGTSDVRTVDVRIIAATNVDLEKRIREGSFRTDLFYRLAVVELRVAPLRERPADIFDLIEHFFAVRDMTVPSLHDETREVLSRYHWPGNVRELQNELERIIAFRRGVREITPDMLSSRVHRRPRGDALDVRMLYDAPLPQAVGYLEENLLRKTLTRNNWNKSESARQLGVSRQGLLKKIRRYGITKGQDTSFVDSGDVPE